jgi:hexosaminidase
LQSHPELADKGAYSKSHTYTEDTVRKVVREANKRGIDVVIEIDVPGHSAAIGESHPEHVACFHDFWNQAVAVEPPAGQLRFASAKTTNFTTSVMESVVKLSTSRYFSHGGDEVNQNCYVSCSEREGPSRF